MGNPYSQAQACPWPRAFADIQPEWVLVQQFLYSYRGSDATFNAYRRELERLLQWAWWVRACSLLQLKREDIQAFLAFCQAPPAHWVAQRPQGRFIQQAGQRLPNPAWRPFVASASPGAGPSPASMKAIFTALASFYDFLLQEQQVAANPLAMIRQKSQWIVRQQGPDPVRRLSTLQWNYLLSSVEQLASADPARHERTLFLVQCLFALYLRISEVVADRRAAPVMGDFRKDPDGHWWFEVRGKGNKNRRIAVSDAMLAALKRYRRFLGLPALPSLGETTPLIARQRGQGACRSQRHVRACLQQCFDRAFSQMQAEGLEEDAQELRQATVHWLRHTAISEDVKTRPREHVRDDAGHASLQTTDRYINSDQRERHLSGRRKPLRDF